MDTYTRKNVPHCPNCHSQRVHHVSRWVWVGLYIIICLAMSIVIIGLFMLLLTPLVYFIPGYWVCRNCKVKTKDKNMLFADVTEKKINHNDKRTFY